ncbi:LacI family DNA-binding transcriptional regulator [Microvirga sp. TS319]|uniref:LacI family DNA-binding transcriptional regulator n=1 Tax=Microvirga sp. TS319 TaxID=3241165 RepID=UPI003519F235
MKNTPAPRPSIPSIRTVAGRAGVSVATVSNVINGKPNVSADVADRVNEAVRELGYTVDMAASRLRSRKSMLAGVVVPDLTNPLFATFVSTLEHLARLDKFDLVVVSSRNDCSEEAARLADMQSWRPAGLIVIPCDGAFKSRRPAGFAIPTVLADRIPDEPDFDLVAVDNAAAAGAVARHLDRHGYETCMVIGSALSISNVRERWEGVRAKAKRMQVDMIEIGIDDPAGMDRLERYLRSGRLAQAIFALDHTTSLLTYRLMADIGIRMPDDVAFASFDEMEWMRLVSPPLTAVRQPVEEMAEQSWALLNRRFRSPTSGPVTRRLKCIVEIRASTPRYHASPKGEIAATTTGG